MRRIIIFVFCFGILTGAGLLGFEKGTKCIGGNVGFTSRKFSEYRYNNLTINPQVSYFILNNVSLDVNAYYAVSWYSDDSKSNPSVGIGIGGRYFLKNFYAGFSFQYYTYRYLDDYNDEAVGSIDYGYKWSKRKDIQFKVGHLIGIAKNIYIDLGVYYRVGLGRVTFSAEKVDLDYDNENTTLGTSIGIAVFLK